VFLHKQQQMRSTGNPYAHLVLRGGKTGPNYSSEHLAHATRLLHDAHVKNPSIIVDASHDNSAVDGRKDPSNQGEVLLDVARSMKEDDQVASIVKGFMVESFLETGRQDLKGKSLPDLVFGQSITDGCIGIEQTAEIIKKLHRLL
jgi:3-deoxy-7-phosphoheptulonate synthase